MTQNPPKLLEPDESDANGEGLGVISRKCPVVLPTRDGRFYVIPLFSNCVRLDLR